MWNVKPLRLLITISLTSILLGPVSCKETTEQPTSFTEDTESLAVKLPGPIERDHLGEAFRITWFEQPFSTHYNRLTLRLDGHVEHEFVNLIWNTFRVGVGQLNKEQQEEIRTILKTVAETYAVERVDSIAARESFIVIKAITETHSVEPIKGPKIITLSFPWRGETYVLSFSESSCMDELHRLLEIIGTALGWSPVDVNVPQNLCRGSNEYQEQIQEPASSAAISLPLASLPGAIKRTHIAPRLFRATWFEQPFDGSYHQLSLFANNSVVYRQIADAGAREVARGRLTEKERQKVQTTLGLITSMSSVEQPVETMLITLSFPWEADRHVFTTGCSDCPDSLQRLFEIANTAFERESLDREDFQNPCQGR
jgi:hypothetical protein